MKILLYLLVLEGAFWGGSAIFFLRNIFNRNPFRRNRSIHYPAAAAESTSNESCNVEHSPSIINPVGIRNLRNTCYMNSVLQALFHAKAFRNSVLQQTFRKDSPGEKLQEVFHSLQEREPVDTKYLASSLGINVGIQEDSEEFYLRLIEKLDDSVINSIEKPSAQLTLKLEQYIRCINVNQTKFREQSYLDLSVDVSDNKESTLMSLITNHFAPETLTGENQYRTANHGLQDAAKGLNLVHTPNVLVMHMKRFAFSMNTGMISKIHTPVNISLELDLSSVAKPAVYHSELPLYDLVAIVVHEGTTDFGHYYCFSRPDPSAFPEHWVKLNDHIVSEVDKATVLSTASGFIQHGSMPFPNTSTNGYLLVYTKRPPSLLTSKVMESNPQHALHTKLGG